MRERPEPLSDLDWEPARAREFTDRVVDLYEELLERLPDLPVTSRVTVAEVRDAVAIEVPEEPMADDALLAYLRDMVFERSMYPGHPRFMAYVSRRRHGAGRRRRPARGGAQHERRRVAALAGRHRDRAAT